MLATIRAETAAASYVVEKLDRQLFAFRDVPKFASEIVARGLVFVVVTASPEQASAIEQAALLHDSFVTRTEMAEGICRAPVFVLPTYYEPLENFMGVKKGAIK